MTRFTQHDRHLWGALIAVVASERVTDVARIHKAAKRAGKASVPEGWYFPGSCFHVLVKDGKGIKGNDPVARAVLRTHAEACRAVLQAQDEGRAVDPSITLGLVRSGLVISSMADLDDALIKPQVEYIEGVVNHELRRRFRRDIDG